MYDVKNMVVYALVIHAGKWWLVLENYVKDMACGY